MTAFFALSATPLMAQQEQFITIGTGGQTGVYYVVGQSICRLVNRETAETGLRCTAPATGGSIDNINQIKAGGMTMGVLGPASDGVPDGTEVVFTATASDGTPVTATVVLGS